MMNKLRNRAPNFVKVDVTFEPHEHYDSFWGSMLKLTVFAAFGFGIWGGILWVKSPANVDHVDYCQTRPDTDHDWKPETCLSAHHTGHFVEMHDIGCFKTMEEALEAAPKLGCPRLNTP
jgi:hypothetical protein